MRRRKTIYQKKFQRMKIAIKDWKDEKNNIFKYWYKNITNKIK